ncbi:glyoxylate reductase/hydroxypyruvate reductase-like [Mizuhopecten yessoensis]|uniref:Glyoxylate reductase/hydroxypyruvate reductase n=1 Tax=Mizuhopecten yessoensis TaxID=6573 RepID=A0A210PJH7_MIZYE|nr:glyoxylate reductase/hydroxypyruvate reductase-like [Mizuhopecten yessoensis]OWF36639.1 Glyoxylate reductase/hydroxypyruvate reductase [Mizuhopecten yessoensis]
MSERPKIFATRGIPSPGMDLLQEECDVTVWPHARIISHEELEESVVGVDGILCHYINKIDDHILDAAGPNLKVVATFAVGYDLIDVEACHKRNVRVGHTPNVLSDSVAELAVALILASSRRLRQGMAAITNGLADGKWENGLYLCGPETKGSTVGIVGLGRIGLAVARRLKGFDVAKFLYYDVNEVPWAAEVSAEFTSFEKLLTESDFVVACCSSNTDNWGLFDKAAFKKMKSSAVFVNVTRGVLVNQDDLYEALTTGQIFAAGLDATTPEPISKDHPLVKLDNCVILPHIGSSTTATRNTMSIMTAKNILAGIKGEPLVQCVKNNEN